MERAQEKRLAAKVGKRIAAARLHAEMTQSQLAERLGIGEEAVSRIERGAVMASLPKLFDIAEILRLRIDDLILGASSRLEEQAMMLAHRIDHLAPADRDFVVEIVQGLAERLGAKTTERRSRR